MIHKYVFFLFKYVLLLHPPLTLQTEVLVRATLSSVTFMSHTACSWLLAHTTHTWYLVYIYHTWYKYLVYFSLTAKGLRGRWPTGWHCNLTSRWWWFAQELILIYLVACPHTWSASVYPYERRGEKQNNYHFMIVRIYSCHQA